MAKVIVGAAQRAIDIRMPHPLTVWESAARGFQRVGYMPRLDGYSGRSMPLVRNENPRVSTHPYPESRMHVHQQASSHA